MGVRLVETMGLVEGRRYYRHILEVGSGVGDSIGVGHIVGRRDLHRLVRGLVGFLRL